MGMWWRGCSRYAGLFHECRRYGLVSHVSGIQNRVDGSKMVNAWHSKSHILPYSHPNAQLLYAKSYAVLARAKPKEEGLKEQGKQPANEHEGPRINKAITADFVRLVTDKGHQVVSRREALDYAKKLKLDLVEVQRNAKPPVCKVMDFHKEKYKQQQKEKDRLKNKTELTVRKGECREIRFAAKTEQKDLQRKAEMAKRLMDRGYRVKCMAMGTEDQNLEELLMRLSTLLEDVSIVEAAPKVERRQAWMIVRHIKFGPAKKKSGQKTPKTVESTKGENELHGNVKKPDESENQSHDSVALPMEEVEEWEESEESESFEQFEDEGVPIIDRLEKIPADVAVDVSHTNEMYVSSRKLVKQVELLMDDVGHDTKTLAELGNSDVKQHSSVNHVRQTLTNNSSIRQGQHALNTGIYPPPGFLPQQGNVPVKDKVEDISAGCPVDASLRSQVDISTGKIAKQVQPLSASLNISPSKQDPFEISDAKHNISENEARQIIDGESSSYLGQHASNIGKSVDSAPKLVNGSPKARVDIPDHDPVDMSLLGEAYIPTSDIVGQVQTSSVDSNNDPAVQDKQEMSNDRIHAPGNNLKHVLVDCSPGNQGNYASKTGKQLPVDILPKQVSDSRGSLFTILKQVQPSHIEGNDNAAPQDESGMLDVKHHILSSDTIGHSSSDQVHRASNTEKREHIDSLSKPASVSGGVHWGIFGQAKSSVVNKSNVAPIQDQIGNSNARNRISNNDSRQVPSAPRSDGLENFASNRKEQTSEVLAPKQANDLGESQPVVLEHVLSSSVDVNTNVTSRDQLGISNSKTHVSTDSTRHVLASQSPSGKGSYASTAGKQAPSGSFSKHLHPSGASRWGIFSAPGRDGVDSQRHSAEGTGDQTDKDQPNTTVGSSISASSKAGTKADPRHLHLQNQRKVPIGGNDAPKQAADKSRQTGWGIFSVRPSDVNSQPATKTTDSQVKSEG